jgi:hypothetical protein
MTNNNSNDTTDNEYSSDDDLFYDAKDPNEGLKNIMNIIYNDPSKLNEYSKDIKSLLEMGASVEQEIRPGVTLYEAALEAPELVKLFDKYFGNNKINKFDYIIEQFNDTLSDNDNKKLEKLFSKHLKLESRELAFSLIKNIVTKKDISPIEEELVKKIINKIDISHHALMPDETKTIYDYALENNHIGILQCFASKTNDINLKNEIKELEQAKKETVFTAKELDDLGKIIGPVVPTKTGRTREEIKAFFAKELEELDNWKKQRKENEAHKIALNSKIEHTLSEAITPQVLPNTNAKNKGKQR